jgi:hypothetical protein
MLTVEFGEIEMDLGQRQRLGLSAPRNSIDRPPAIAAAIATGADAACHPNA